MWPPHTNGWGGDDGDLPVFGRCRRSCVCRLVGRNNTTYCNNECSSECGSMRTGVHSGKVLYPEIRFPLGIQRRTNFDKSTFFARIPGIARSSNGRTTVSGTVYLGSSPSLAAQTKTRLVRGVFLFVMKRVWTRKPDRAKAREAGSRASIAMRDP